MDEGGEGHGALAYECASVLTEHKWAAGKLDQGCICAKYRVHRDEMFLRAIEQKVLWLPIANRCHSLPLGEGVGVVQPRTSFVEQLLRRGKRPRPGRV